MIYEEAHGRIPEKFTVIHKDGNKNNLLPENLALRSMAECARQNAWHRRREKFPGLAQRIADKAWDTKNRRQVVLQRGATAALLQLIQQPQKPGLLAALQRRK